MWVRLPFGRGHLDARVPDGSTVVEPSDLPALADQPGAVRAALAHPLGGRPLGELLGPRDHVAVVFPDITRPMPNRTVLPPIVEELERLGAGPDRVALLCATGTHREAGPDELAELVGPDLVARYRVHQHRADGRHVQVGRVDGVPILLDSRYVAADVRICTGFVEPHFFAGFSGGPKGVCPGLAATETILEAHSAARIADPRATWLRTGDNPVHRFVSEATALAPPDLCVDVTLDAARRLTSVSVGPLPVGHARACALVARTAVTPVPGPFDVVVTTNGGHPLDRNLYQAVKGMAAADRVVRPGGTVIVAAACGDGLPAGGAFARLLGRDRDPGPHHGTDAWQVQVMERVLGRARVMVHATGLSDDELRTAGLEPAPDLQDAVDRAVARAGPGCRVCVLVHGPLAVATTVPAA